MSSRDTRRLNLTPEQWKARKTAQRHVSEERKRRERAVLNGEDFIDLNWNREALEKLNKISQKYRSAIR